MCEAGDEKYVAIDLAGQSTPEGLAAIKIDIADQAEFRARVVNDRLRRWTTGPGSFTVAQTVE